MKKCRYFEFCSDINLNHGFIQFHDLPFYFAFLFLFLFSDHNITPNLNKLVNQTFMMKLSVTQISLMKHYSKIDSNSIGIFLFKAH